MTWVYTVKEGIPITQIKLNKTSLSLQPNQNETLVATVSPDNATDKSVSWSSSPTGIVTVSSSGLVTAVKEGTTTVTCKANDGSGVSATCKVTVTNPDAVVAEINSTNFPDANFRSWLLSQSYGADGKLTESEMNSVTFLNVENKGINNLKGVEYFTELTSLTCGMNSLTSLDISKNVNLTHLSCERNQLSSLNLSNNKSLVYINMSYNKIQHSYMDELVNSLPKNTTSVPHNLMVANLYYNSDGNICTKTQVANIKAKGWTPYCYISGSWEEYEGSEDEPVIAEINATNFPDESFRNWILSQSYGTDGVLTESEISKITIIFVAGSNDSPGTIRSLKGIEFFTALTWLICYNNQLTYLDVSKNTALEKLHCGNAQLTSLDVSKNTVLTELYCYRNQIKGTAMDALINSLPQNQTNDKHSFCVIDNTEGDEGNVCTKAQVAAAKAKGWTPRYYNGTKWTEYEGSEDTPSPQEITDIAQYSNIVYVEPVTASPESTVGVAVKMKNAQANITGFQFDLVLPTGVSLMKDEDEFYMVDVSGDRTTARKHTVTAQQQADGSVRVICYSNNNSTFSGNDGNVLEMMLQVDGGVAAGDYQLTLRDVVMTTPTLDNFSISQVVCRLTIEDYKPGDVNGDRVVNVVDVAGVVNLILNSGNTAQLNSRAADVNGDGAVNVVDVAGVVNLILNGAASARPMAPNRAAGQPQLYFSDCQAERGETFTLPILLDAGGDSFTGCQFDLCLPAGLSVAEEDGFPLVETGSGTTSRKHTVSTSVQPDGSLRVVCYSNTNSTFSGQEILKVDIRIADDAPTGDAVIALRNIVLSRPDVTGATPDNYENVLVVGEDPSGINALHYDGSNGAPVYNLRGQRLSAPQKGVNIIGGKKVVIK